MPEQSHAARPPAQTPATDLADLVRQVEEAEVVPVDLGLPGLGVERLVLHLLVDRERRGEVWTRERLEGELEAEVPPAVVAAAVGRLRGAGAVTREGERVLPSRCVLFMDTIGAIAF